MRQACGIVEKFSLDTIHPIADRPSFTPQVSLSLHFGKSNYRTANGVKHVFGVGPFRYGFSPNSINTGSSGADDVDLATTLPFCHNSTVIKLFEA